MPDPNCPRCYGRGEIQGTTCEECTILPRGGYQWKTEDKPRARGATFAELAARVPGLERSKFDRVRDDYLDAFPFSRELGADEPEEWLFVVQALVDNPAGSGERWPIDKKVNARDFLPIEIQLVGPDHATVRKEIATQIKLAGHSRWLLIKIERKDRETLLGRSIAGQALAFARQKV